MGKRLALITVLCVAWLSTTASAQEPLPTSDELHKLYDAKEYQPLIQKLTRVLQLKGAAAQPYDRVDMLMLRGEAFVQLKQQMPAIDAFDSAAKEATAPQQTVKRKPGQVALARATALLVHQSHNLQYTPKVVTAGEKPQPISLLDMSQRPDAFKALLADQEADLTPKAKAASRSTSLAPIIQLIRGLGDLRAVELIATKATKDSDAMLGDMADRAYKLMDAEVDRLAPAADQISKAAHQKSQHVTIQRDSKGGVLSTTTTISQRGLFSADTNNLKQIVSTCQQIFTASHDFADVTAATQAAQFNTLAGKAEKCGTMALQTLNDDYSPVSQTNNVTSTR